MDMDLLRKELERYEGVKYQVYLDTKGLKTAGVGHLLTGDDTNMNVGDTVTEDQVTAWFASDLQGAAARVQTLIGSDIFSGWDDIYQRIFANLSFNLGNRLMGFHNTLACAKNSDWAGTATNLEQSAWYNQVGTRGVEMCEALRNGAYSWEN